MSNVMSTSPMQAGPRIAYVLGGNRYSPRAHVVKLFTADGPKEMNVLPSGPLKRMIETIVEMAPARMEAYDKDGKLLRSLDLTKLENPDGDEAADGAASETTVHVTREERLLAHFANLLAQSRQSSDDMVAKAFSRMSRIAEHYANASANLEHRNAVLQNAMVKQATVVLQTQLAAAQAQMDLRNQQQGGGEDGDSAFADYIRKVVQGELSGDDEPEKPAANGAAPASGGAKQ